MMNLQVLSLYKSLLRKVAFSRQTGVSGDQLFTDHTVTVTVAHLSRKIFQDVRMKWACTVFM